MILKDIKETELKSKFVEMCQFIQISGNGFIFLSDSIKHDESFSHITRDKSYRILESKMDSFIKLINTDSFLIEKDIETEIWQIL